ncbi:MAG: MBL fold metallo-hydrolase [Bdellovibrionales bacterium]|nr:MBL fold metallo-hydrolase [Bdellovibrionales bacterium]MCB0412717.1 MBL fold metallo-hydrolase [Bdellovibrionales bacterium]
MRISFLGGAGTVTGSKYLVEDESLDGPILLDCGLFQGLKNLRLKNRDPLSVDPTKLSAVILTHAHLDHSGYLPLLVKNGFKGPIYCSDATFELCKILLPDSGYLQEEEARYANKRRFSKHNPALPLYTQEDAEKSLSVFKPVKRHNKIKLGSNASFELFNAGHILGSSFVRIQINGKLIIFSGDLGRPNDSVMKAPEDLVDCDYLVVESTYGNRKHDNSNPIGLLAELAQDAWKNKAVIVIPAFAVGRAQTLLHLFADLKNKGQIPNIPIYLNSPMATNVTKVFCDFQDDHRLNEQQCHEACEVAKYIRSPEESKDLNTRSGPMIIISASGMATGGRVIHHLKAFVENPKNIILFAGFQAAGTRGASMMAGAEEIKIHGQYFRVKARIVNIDSFSAHADYSEILNWLDSAKKAPMKVFVTHGEASASDSLRQKIEEKFNWNVEVPFLGESKELS